MADYRVKVRRSRVNGDPVPWHAWLEAVDGDRTTVGEFLTMREAVTRGCTALRFVSVGIPWREGARARRDDA